MKRRSEIQTGVLTQFIDCLLQIFQKSACVGTVHLGVMKLEGNRQTVTEPFPSVLSPKQEWIVINAAVHTHNAIQLCIHNGRGSDNHSIFRQISVSTGIGCLRGMGQIFLIEDIQIRRIKDITGTDFTGSVFYDGIDCQGIISNQVLSHRKHIKLFHI